MTKQASARKRGRGRPSGDIGSREAILDAALGQFSELGYGKATVRGIASEAGVDPALVSRAFGGKEKLFAATISGRAHIAERIHPALVGDPDQVGARLVSAYLDLWEDPQASRILTALVRAAVTEAGPFRDALTEVQTSLRPPLNASSNRYPFEGLEIAAGQLLGVAIGRYVLALPPFSTMDRDTLVDILAPSIQACLTTARGGDGPLGRQVRLAAK